MVKTILKLIIRKIPRKLQIPFTHCSSILLMPFVKGGRYSCPICQKAFKCFFAYGINRNYRTNALCPSCFSLERHRLLWLYLEQETDFFSKKYKLLHLAPEQCFYHRFKSRTNLEYITADLESPLADNKIDICQMSFANSSFDVIICSHVLEHVKDDKKALKEIKRVLKPNGWGIIQVPLEKNTKKTYENGLIKTAKEKELAYGRHDHVRQYGFDFINILNSAGFKTKEIDYLKNLSQNTVDKHCLAFRCNNIFYKISL